MNATEVLKKILTTLALVKEEVEFTYAKLADGTILESPTFDVGESVDVVSEDGTKTAAPDGEHEVVLKDSEGNEERIKVITKDGKITERENVELEAPAEEEEVKMESEAGGDMGDDEEVDTEETAEPISEDMKSVITKLQYRIEELEKKITKMEEVFPPVNDEKISEPSGEEVVKAEPLPGDVSMAKAKMEIEELPKLDGAPIDENAQKTNIKLGKNSISANPQNTFLSKLYK